MDITVAVNHADGVNHATANVPLDTTAFDVLPWEDPWNPGHTNAWALIDYPDSIEELHTTTMPIAEDEGIHIDASYGGVTLGCDVLVYGSDRPTVTPSATLYALTVDATATTTPVPAPEP